MCRSCLRFFSGEFLNLLSRGVLWVILILCNRFSHAIQYVSNRYFFVLKGNGHQPIKKLPLKIRHDGYRLSIAKEHASNISARFV